MPLHPLPPEVASALTEDLINVEVVLCLLRGVLIPDAAQAPKLASRVENVAGLLSGLQRDLDAHLASIGVTAMGEWARRLEVSRARVDALYADLKRPKTGAEQFGSRMDHEAEVASSVVADLVARFPEQK